MSEADFPPFVPAKPKGGVAAELAAAGPLEAVVESTFKPKRKRRTREEMAATNGAKSRRQRSDQLAGRSHAVSVPMDALVAFAGLKAEEIEQVVNTCEAINTFPKQARKRIAAAIGQLFS